MLRQINNLNAIKEIVSDIDKKYEGFINQYKNVIQCKEDCASLDINFNSDYDAFAQEESSEQKEEKLEEAKENLALLRNDLDKKLNTSSLYLGFPRKELWRLCIDQKYQNNEAKDNPFYFDERRAISVPDKNYFEGERYIFLEEPGYLYGMEKAFLLLEKTLNLPLSVELIASLHDMSVSTIIKKDEPLLKKGIRSTNKATVGLTENINYSYEGIAELLDLYNNYANIANFDTHEICDNINEICEVGGKSRFTRIDAVDAKNFPLLLQKFIAQYYNEIKIALTPYQKIHAIAEFIHKCNVLHPFHDANVRTFVFLITNRLLFENGLPLALFEDPNRFDGYSVKQLCLEVINGIAHSVKISKIKFNVATLRAVAEKEIIIENENFKSKRELHLSKIDIYSKIPPKLISLEKASDAKSIKFFSELSRNIDLTAKPPISNGSNDTYCGFKPGFLIGKRF